MKKPSLSSWKRKTQEVFNQYIRLRDCLETTGTPDYGVCITCGKNVQNKEADAGHFISVRYSITRFDERNVFLQCVYCNRWLHGALDAYFVALEKKFGREVVDELIASKSRIKKWTIPELQELYKTYTEKYNSLT